MPVLLTLLALIPGASHARVPEIVKVERSFAATAREQGIAAAFRTFSAPDALIFNPDPKPGKALIDAAPDRAGSLVWWPVYAGVAASDDLAFTTGPFVAANGEQRGRGQYFTVWRRQKDGSWRWVLDHGPRSDADSPADGEEPLQLLPVAQRSGMSKGAWIKVTHAEAALAEELARDARRALLARFDKDGRLMRNGPQPAVGPAAIKALLVRQPARLITRTIGGGVSKAGDLAFTYGDASWDAGDGPKRGHYVRIWQNRPRGWTLVVDSVIPVPAR